MKAARTDNSSKALRAYAEQLGFIVVVLNAAVDCLLVWGQRVFIVDWKTPGSPTLTPQQIKLIARGVPVRFISTPEQLDALKTEVAA